MINESSTDRIFDICNKILIWFFIIIISYPLLYILSASISDPSYVNSGKMWLFPRDITFEGFKRVFESKDIWIGIATPFFIHY